jgi:hypothetical protein
MAATRWAGDESLSVARSRRMPRDSASVSNAAWSPSSDAFARRLATFAATPAFSCKSRAAQPSALRPFVLYPDSPYALVAGVPLATSWAKRSCRGLRGIRGSAAVLALELISCGRSVARPYADSCRQRCQGAENAATGALLDYGVLPFHPIATKGRVKKPCNPARRRTTAGFFPVQLGRVF